MALHRDYLMPVEDREDELIDHAATLISPENGTMRRSRCRVKRLIDPLGTPLTREQRFLSGIEWGELIWEEWQVAACPENPIPSSAPFLDSLKA